VQFGFDQVITGLGDYMRVDDKFAGVDAEPGGRIGGQGKVFAVGIVGVLETNTQSIRNGKRCGDQILIAGNVGVDVQALGDAKVEGDLGWFSGGNVDLLGKHVLDCGAPEDGSAC
jgi:hypothetical protein